MAISNGVNKQVVINNLLISYSEVQSGGAQTLLFLHGWRSQKEVWLPVIQKLSVINSQLSIYAIDLPGFGGSQAPTTPPRQTGHPSLNKEGNTAGWTVGDYVNIVAEFIGKLELKNVIVVGHSFGGRVAIKLASVNPKLVNKVVLVDSAGFAMEASKKKLAALAAKIVKPVFKPKVMQGLRKKIYQTIGAEDYVAIPELQKTFVNVTNEDLSDDMKKIQAPTLIIFGENDKETPATYGELMKFLIPKSKCLILKGTGHFSFLERPEEFVKILSDFILS